jgi:hypothetical protein
MNDLRPAKTGWKQLNRMTKHELIHEIKRLDEVICVTARRLNAHKKEAAGKNEKPCDLLTYTWLELTPTRVKDALRFHMLKRMSSIFNRKQGKQLIQG